MFWITVAPQLSFNEKDREKKVLFFKDWNRPTYELTLNLQFVS